MVNIVFKKREALSPFRSCLCSSQSQVLSYHRNTVLSEPVMILSSWTLHCIHYRYMSQAQQSVPEKTLSQVELSISKDMGLLLPAAIWSTWEEGLSISEQGKVRREAVLRIFQVHNPDLPITLTNKGLFAYAYLC